MPARQLLLTMPICLMAVAVLRPAAAQDIIPAPEHQQPAPEAIRRALDEAVQTSDWGSTPPVRLELPGIENAWRLTEQIYAGSAPPSPPAMRALHDLGVRTLISIDLQPPAHWTAVEHSLTYAHVPMRHGRLTPGDYLRLLRVVSYMEGAYYIHGAPGEQRVFAPAAMSTHVAELRTAARMLYFLDTVGLPLEETGLWYAAASPLAYTKLDQARLLPAHFPAAIAPPPMIWWMRRFDESFAVLRESHRRAWNTPPEEVGTSSVFEAGAIEGMASRWIDAHPAADASLREEMQRLRDAAHALRTALQSGNNSTATTAWHNLSTACQQCHTTHRDRGE